MALVTYSGMIVFGGQVCFGGERARYSERNGRLHFFVKINYKFPITFDFNYTDYVLYWNF